MNNTDNLIALQNYKQNTFFGNWIFLELQKRDKRELNKGMEYNLHITLKKNWNRTVSRDFCHCFLLTEAEWKSGSGCLAGLQRSESR